MSGRKWQKKIEKFRALDAADKWMLLHATVWLALACIMLLVLPFRQLAKRLALGGDLYLEFAEDEVRVESAARSAMR